MQFNATYPLKTQVPTIDVDQFYQALKNAKDLLWEQATPCPCRENEDSEAPRYACPICSGTGWEYETGIAIKGVVAGASTQDNRFREIGWWIDGIIEVTVAPELCPGIQDRYALPRSAMIVQDIPRRKGTVDVLRWPAVQRGMLVEISGTEQQVELSVLRLRVGNADGTAGALLTLGTDFAVTAAGAIDWTLGIARGTAPAIGQRYAIRYYGSPRYIVQSRPHAMRDTKVWRQHGGEKKVPSEFAALPVQSIAKLDWDQRTP